MDCRKHLVIATAVVTAVSAMIRPAAAPELEYRNPTYVSNHKLIPVPVMGVRAEASVLDCPVNA